MMFTYEKKKYRSVIFILILCSLRKQPIFCGGATVFPPTEMTSVEQCRNSILIMTYYCPDLGSVSDWSKQSFRVAQPLRTEDHYSYLGSNTSSVWNFCTISPDVILRGNQFWRRDMSVVLSG